MFTSERSFYSIYDSFKLKSVIDRDLVFGRGRDEPISVGLGIVRSGVSAVAAIIEEKKEKKKWVT